MMLKRLLVGMLLLLGWCGAVWSDPNQAAVVTRVDPGTVGVNFGSQQRAQYGQTFYVYRHGLSVGQIRLSQVAADNSTAQVIQTEPGAAIQIGDVVSAYAPRPGSATAASLGVVPSQPYAYAAPGAPVDLSNAQANFQNEVQARTRTFKFDAASHSSVGTAMPFVTGFGLYEDYRLASLGVFGEGRFGGVNPWLIGSTAYSTYEGVELRQRMNNMPGAGNATHRVYLEAIYWDEGLVSSYNRYSFAKAGKPVDANTLEQSRLSMLAQKGISNSLVFQVQITNHGISPVTLSPFNDHFTLVDANGNKIKATRYDGALDSTISPNSSANGYLYFNRMNANGQPITGGPVTIKVDDVLGKHASISW